MSLLFYISMYVLIIRAVSKGARGTGECEDCNAMGDEMQGM